MAVHQDIGGSQLWGLSLTYADRMAGLQDGVEVQRSDQRDSTAPRACVRCSILKVRPSTRTVLPHRSLPSALFGVPDGVLETLWRGCMLLRRSFLRVVICFQGDRCESRSGTVARGRNDRRQRVSAHQDRMLGGLSWVTPVGIVGPVLADLICGAERTARQIWDLFMKSSDHSIPSPRWAWIAAPLALRGPA
jgi:hypothetical protein